jgi:hypothetical protein
MTGKGFLQCKDGSCFTGDFKEGKLHGHGKFFVKNGTYSIEGKYTEGAPEYTANKYLFNLVSPVEEGGIDTKVEKGKGGKPPAPVEEEPKDGNAVKISIDMCNPDE